MSYIFRGNLCGYLCSDCSEPLYGVKVRLYQVNDARDVTAMAAANPDDTFHPVSDEEVGEKRGRLIAETTADEKGDFTFRLSAEDKYKGQAFEVDIWCPTGYRKPPKPPRGDEESEREAGYQYHITTLQPFWRQDRRDEQAQSGSFYWNYCIPSKWWCRILALLDLWVICGQITTCKGGIAVAGAKVSAFDADWLQHDPLGVATTDSGGHFTIYYSRADFEKTIFSWISLEFVSGPDLYFKVEAGSGAVLLQESPSAGRRRGRRNVGNCACVNLCVDVEIPPPVVTPVPDFTHIGAVEYETQMRSAPFQDGLTNSEYAFHGNLRLNGILAQTFNGQPMEYCFEYSKTYNAAGRPINWQRVLPSQILQTHIGRIQKAVLVTPPAPDPPYLDTTYTQCYVSNAPIPGAFVTTPDAQGWILVPQQHDNPYNLAGVGLFDANDNLINFPSTVLMPATSLNLTGLAAGEDYTVSTGQPLVQDEICALRMLVREQGNNASIVVAGTCRRIAIDNTTYSGMQHHPAWSAWGGGVETGVCMLDIQQLIAAGCAKITTQVDILYSVAHPHLGSIGLLLEGPGPDLALGPIAPVTDNNFGIVTHTFAPTDPECAYLVTLDTTYLLTNGDNFGVYAKDYMAFCR